MWIADAANRPAQTVMATLPASNPITVLIICFPIPSTSLRRNAPAVAFRVHYVNAKDVVR